MNQITVHHHHLHHHNIVTVQEQETTTEEEEAAEDQYEYHAQFLPDDYNKNVIIDEEEGEEEGQVLSDEHEECNVISIFDVKGILKMEKELMAITIASRRSTSTTEESTTPMNSSFLGDDDHESRSEMMIPEDSHEAVMRQEKELSRAIRWVEHGAGTEQPVPRYLTYHGGQDTVVEEDEQDQGGGGGGIRQWPQLGSSMQMGVMPIICESDLAVASLVMEEGGGGVSESQEPQDHVQKAEPLVTNIHLEKRTCRIVLGSLLVAIALMTGILVGVVVLPSLDVDEDGRNDTAEAMGDTLAPTTYRESLGIQEHIALLLGSSKLTNTSTPHYKALQWILHKDPLQLPKSATNLIQRYILVLFYFLTTKNGPWRTCNPATLENETHICDFQTLRWVFPELAFDTVQKQRWLSPAHECDWAGIVCEQNVVIDIKLGKFLIHSGGGGAADLGSPWLITQSHFLHFNIITRRKQSLRKSTCGAGIFT